MKLGTAALLPIGLLAGCAGDGGIVPMLDEVCQVTSPVIAVKASVAGTPLNETAALSAFYPERASRHSKAGHAVIACAVVGGRPANCATIEENPAGFGFADSARKAAATLHLPTDSQEVQFRLEYVVIKPSWNSCDQ